LLGLESQSLPEKRLLGRTGGDFKKPMAELVLEFIRMLKTPGA